MTIGNQPGFGLQENKMAQTDFPPPSISEIIESDSINLHQMQAFHAWLDEVKQFDQSVMINLAYLAGEVGEVINAVRDSQRAEAEAIEVARDHIAEELADCLAFISKLANYMDIDLQAAYIAKMKKNIGRTWTR